VAVEIELRIVHPDRPAQIERYGSDALALPRDQVQLGGDQVLDVGQ
jgi:hypothetical protein